MTSSVFGFVVAVLATVGGAWAIAQDDVGKPLHDRLWALGWHAREMTTEEGVGEVSEPTAGRGWARFFWHLTNCPYCVGAWFSLFATAVLLGWHPLTMSWWLVVWGMRGANVVVTAVLLRVLDCHQ